MNNREDWAIPKDIIKCNKCKKTYKPDKECISICNPNYYYKTCKKCRGYMKAYIDNNKHLHYSNYQPSLFN